MKDTIAEAEAVRAKYRNDLANAEQAKARECETPVEPEPEVTEEAPPPVAKKLFDKVDEKRKKKSAKCSST